MKIMRVKQQDGTLVDIPIGMEATNSAVSVHNTDSSAHADIRERINQLSSEKVNISQLSEEVETEVEQQLDGAKADIVTEIITQLGGLPVFGTVDENNVITTTTRLFNGTYVLRYKDENNTYSELAEFTVTGGAEDVITYTVKNTLVACKSSNATTTVNSGTSYTATITPDADPVKGGNYNLSAIYVKMGGIDVSATAVSGNTINIANVTGDISISCVGYRNDSRISGSNGVYKAQSGVELTGFIPGTYNSTVYMKNVVVTSASTEVVAWYGSDPVDDTAYTALTGCVGNASNTSVFGTTTGELVSCKISSVVLDAVTNNKNNIAYMRISANAIGANSIITVDEPIV